MNIKFFCLITFPFFLVVKVSVYFNRHVFVMEQKTENSRLSLDEPVHVE